MSRLNLSNILPYYNRQAISMLFNSIEKQLNGISEGQISAVTNASSTVPTTGSYQVGDFVRNSSPSELGTAGSKYVVMGWICTAAPTTFVQCRALTGN